LLRVASRGEHALDAAAIVRAPLAARREALRAWAETTTGRIIRRAHLDALEVALQGRGCAQLPGGWAVRLTAGTLRAHLDPRPDGWRGELLDEEA
nr:hypothetical protein [Myxococcota bacterium]